jgi:acetyl esterase/lipase
MLPLSSQDNGTERVMNRIQEMVWRSLVATVLCCIAIRADEPNSPLPNANRTPEAPHTVFPIWPGVAPGSENWTQQEVEYRGFDGKLMIRNVVTPTLTVFAPEPKKATGAAIIICPGGGFRFLSWQNEGTDVARWLQKRGVTAFVLKYRLQETPADEAEFARDMLGFMFTLVKFRDRDLSSEAAQSLAEDLRMSCAAGIADGRQAVKVVRESAKKWNLKQDRIGMMGFSAGAMITNATCVGDDAQGRPDFAASIYGPVLGEIKVPAHAPPLFILCTSDDQITEASSVRLYSAWRDAGYQAELHIFEKGGHGFGMAKKNLPVDGWINRFGDWLEMQGLLNK